MHYCMATGGNNNLVTSHKLILKCFGQRFCLTIPEHFPKLIFLNNTPVTIWGTPILCSSSSYLLEDFYVDAYDDDSDGRDGDKIEPIIIMADI